MRRKLSKANLARIEAGEPPEPSEDEIQAVIVDGLRAYGYLVLITSRRVKKCHKCGTYPKSGRGDGVSRGLADLLVRHPTWLVGIWKALEVKREGPIKWSSPEQKQLALVGDIVVVRSIEEAIDAVRNQS